MEVTCNSSCDHYRPATLSWFGLEGETLPCPPSFEYNCSHPLYNSSSSKHLWQQFMDAPPYSPMEEELGEQLAEFISICRDEIDVDLMQQVKCEISGIIAAGLNEMQEWLADQQTDVDMEDPQIVFGEEVRNDLLNAYSASIENMQQDHYTA